MKTVLLPALLLAALLVACGGDGDRNVVDISPAPSPQASPTGTAVPLPEKPSQFEAIPDAIAGYLTAAGGSADCLEELLQAWEMPDGTAACAAADLDGDGKDEYVVTLAREAEAPASPEGLEGTVLVFDSEDSAYAVVFRLEELVDATGQPVFAVAEGRIPDPAILDPTDVDGDGRAELALTSTQCGAHTCSVSLCLIALADGAYAPVVQSSEGGGCIAAPVADDQIRFEDVDGDGVLELLFREGLIGSVGAGPQRELTRTYRWGAGGYSPAGVAYDPSDLRYFKVRDADDALLRGDQQEALKLYREAVNDPGLQDAELGDAAELLAYARFRIAVTLAVLQDSEGALAALDEAIAADPDALHSQMAAVFRQGYAKVRHVSPGCAAARDFVQSNLEAFSALWDYGYANPAFDPDALCPF